MCKFLIVCLLVTTNNLQNIQKLEKKNVMNSIKKKLEIFDT